jgi:hypothetical protein
MAALQISWEWSGAWQGNMPFPVNSRQEFILVVVNTDDVPHPYRIDMTFPMHGGMYGGTLRPGHGRTCKDWLYMPPDPGTYTLSYSVSMDNVEIGKLSFDVTVA